MKRRAEDDEVSSDSTESDGSKKWQHQRIFSDAHIRTVDLLMSLLRELLKHPHQEEPNVEAEAQTDTDPEVSRQKPYWPVISRLKQPQDL